MGRSPCCDKANVKKGPWSPEEDTILKSHIDEHGTGGNWIALPHKIGLKRCGKSCRLRWLNYLRPNIKHGGFSEDEDNLICTLYITIGSRWSIMAAQLPGRTDNDIKNYWNTRLKKKLFGCKKLRTNGLNNHIDFSLTDIAPIMPLGYDHTQPNYFVSDVRLYDQQVCKEYQRLEKDVLINRQSLDGVMNSSSISSSSLENISWEDTSCIGYPQSAMINYDQEIAQYSTFLDEPSSLGFSL